MRRRWGTIDNDETDEISNQTDQTKEQSPCENEKKMGQGRDGRGVKEKRFLPIKFTHHHHEPESSFNAWL